MTNYISFIFKHPQNLLGSLGSASMGSA